MQPLLSVLQLILPGPSPPTSEEVAKRLTPYYRPFAEAEHLSGGWHQPWGTPEGDQHVVSLLPFDAAAAEGPLIIAQLHPEGVRQARAAKWSLCDATELPPANPLPTFGRQMRLCSIAAPEAVAVHDFASQRVFCTERCRVVGSWATPPPARELFVVHAVGPDRGRRGAWMHTHGLERAGLPDVELLRVPHDLMDAASDLIDAFVRANLGRRVPLAGSTDDLVLGHRIEWIPAASAT